MNFDFVKLGKTASVLFLALAMAGCGGGSGDTSSNAADMEREAQALAAAQMAASAAAAAAMMASDDAMAAVDEVAEDQDADIPSFTLARIAENEAKNAYMAAKAASDAAAMAATSADAVMYQTTAEAQQAAAAVAGAAAMMYAGMVADSAADDAAEYAERMALADARTAAMTAADMAKMASDAAAAAVAAADADQSADLPAYTRAQDAATAAMDAYMAAKAASDAAAMAATSADAAMHVTEAMAQQTAAEEALAMAMSHASTVTESAVEAMALSTAQTAAMEAAAEARMAADDAQTAVDDSAASKDLNTIAAAAHARAEDAAADAATAWAAAQAASESAAMAGSSADAAMYQAAAEAALVDALAAAGSAQTFASVVTGIQQGVDEAATELALLTAAQGAAMTAAESARTAATDAQTAADTILELTGAGSGQAVAAQTAADAAETAAMAAEMANTAAQAAGDSATAQPQADEAVAQQGHADDANATAQGLVTEAQVASDAAIKLLEERDIADAQEAAMEAAEMALSHYNSAVTKATDARTQANNAAAAVSRARLARTDHTTANTHATAAATAATEAEAAQVRAATAKDDAQAAYMAAMGADNSVDAEMYQDQAEAANEAATENHTGMTGAGMAYMRARDAAADAAMAANTHVRDLLRAANASGESDADDRKDEVTAVAGVIAVSAKAADHGSESTTATVMWAHDTPDNTGTEDENEFAATPLSMSIGPGGGTALMFETMTVADDPDTTNVDEGVTKTATQITGLPGFTHGYEISSGRQHVLVFSDKVQGTGPAEAETVSFTNRAVQISRISAVAEDQNVTDLATLGTHTTYDHDGDEDTDAVSGTYRCVPDGDCLPQLEDGKVTGFVGGGTVYFSTTGDQTIMAAVDADPKNDYLVFGVWLTEDDPETDNANERAVGAFAASGNADFATPESLTGSATYNGAAAGLYTEGTAVDYFQGVATLNARFGTAEEDETDTEEGTITGTINSIVAGGRSMSDVIRLNSDSTPRTNEAPTLGNILATGSFNGNARMGTAEVDGDLVVYPYNGTWTGQFYGAADEGALPPAAAGTFGVSGTQGTGDDAVTRSYVGAFGARR